MRWILPLIAISLLAACAAPQYTVDDGRAVDEELLGHIRSYGAGEKVLRPAIARSAELNDPDCDTQWELPFSVATSYDLSADDRVAWVRGLGVDERLTVVAAAPDSPLQVRDKISLLQLPRPRVDTHRHVQPLVVPGVDLGQSSLYHPLPHFHGDRVFLDHW